MPTKPFFVRPVDLGTVTAGNTAAGYPASSLNRFKAIGLTWRTVGNANLWARGQFGSAQAIDFCAIVAGNAQPGTTYRLRLGNSQAEVDGTAPYDSGDLPYISPAITSADGLYHSHLELPSVQTATWWRIDIGGHTGDFQASMLVLGQKVQPSKFYNLDFEYGVKDLGNLEWGRYGVLDEDPGLIARTVAFTLAWNTEAEFETSFRPMMEQLGKRGIVYLVFDPEATAYRQAKTFMGVFDKPPAARGVRKPKTYSQDFALTSFI